MGQQKRERKLTGRTHCRPFAEQRDRASPREELAGCGRTSSARGRRQGCGERGRLGPKNRSPYRAANRPPVSNQRPPEILDGRHPREGRGGNPGRRHLTGQRGRAGTGAGDAEGRRRAAPGRVLPSSSWLPEPLRRGRRKKQAQLFVPGFCGTPEGWNRAQRRARSI